MAINRSDVIEHVSKLQIKSDSNGLIPAFSVLVAEMPAGFWNTFAVRLVEKVDSDVRPAAEELLVNCAYECGYHTGHGIIDSEEWKAIVAPSVEGPEDVLHGLYAVMTAWGLVDSTMVELVPGERMVVQAVSYYEADEGEVKNPRSPGAYMIRGMCSSFMDLVYSGEYNPIVGPRKFRCEQIKGIECGDEIGEFVTTRSSEAY